MKRILCIALFSAIILLVGCGEPAASQGSADMSGVLSQSGTETGLDDTSCQSLADEDSASDMSDVLSNTSESSDTTKIYSEVEMDFSDFE